MKKISYLIVNKDANTKAISKEIFKLNVIIANSRISNLVNEYDRLVEKVNNGESREIQKDMMRFCDPVKNEVNVDFEEWTRTQSSQSIGADGQLRDECALAWPLSYHELSEEEFSRKTAQIMKLNCENKFFTYKNVLLTLPINLNGNLDALVLQVLKD